MMTTQTILDLVVIVLLVPTIVYAVILNRKLGALRRSRDELAKVVASFSDATLRAEAGIPKLKKATTEANHILKDRVEKAQTLRDDLAFMIERAEELATRLESAVRVARQDNLAAGPSLPAAATGPTPAVRGMATEPPPRTLAAATLAGGVAQASPETAAELRSALGLARAEARVTGAPAAAPPARPRRGAAERSLADRAMADRSLSERMPADEPSLDEERSEAERELLKALQAAR
jgi:hypothetical protein